MISEVAGIITSDLVDVLQSDGFQDTTEQESVEDRVITASLTMIRRSNKNAELTERLMLLYAVFAEDVCEFSSFLLNGLI